MSRKGMTLVLTLVMAALIGASAILLFNSANMEMQIASNVRRMNQAKISATSGLNHFTALGLDYDTLRERAGGLQTLQILPMTRLSDKTSYEVKVYFSPRLSAGQYVVESIGYYTRAEKILATHPIKALFESGQ
ncbi:MAG: pilus assembly PilX N-terminal domain-containing protein [Candidatus Poseidoniales archaeon]